ncbi:MAG: hypothetical protein EOM19_01085 [Candidatus Moranbacteria bacterium]|nr:hypothetical protein [Candidatus Moranbacteria bacterium]
MNTKFGIASLFFVSVFFLVGSVLAEAPSGGWLWSGSESQEGSYQGMGWFNASSTDGNQYKIEIPEVDGGVSGYAWSEHYGWIDFQPEGPYPTAPSHSVQRAGKMLTGWARILSIQNEGVNSGNWNGWIKMSGSTYGVDLDIIAKNKEGTLPYQGTYAWSDELGWIDFGRMGFVGTPGSTEKDLVVCLVKNDNSLTPLTTLSRTLALNKSEKYKVFYNNTNSCDDTDVTVSSSWKERNDEAPSVDVIQVSGGGTAFREATSSEKQGTESVDIEYNDPSDGKKEKEMFISVIGGGGGAPAPKPVEKPIWKEVAP